MIKRIALIALLLLPVWATAQKSEIGVAGGVRSDGSYIGSLAYYLKLWKLQVGAVGELSQVNTNRSSIIGGFNDPGTHVFCPGINVNFIIPFPRGYVYPGIAGRYTAGIDEKVKGIDLGLHAGIVVKLVKSLSVNAEIGARYQDVKYEGVMNKLTFATTEPAMPVVINRLSYMYVPMTLGLRLAF